MFSTNRFQNLLCIFVYVVLDVGSSLHFSILLLWLHPSKISMKNRGLFGTAGI